ncbi:MAG: Unknown protein [uncultured Sulfurovum sp.]|uniref:Uncharacterized protein n=1 Tax=uncultured Sulfurovum sp. TaxID=269237 RepID=A0A6S6T669_9BACT|nr:MAG: Unknown protein [uncultured Sulfurovum sp.]
MTKTKLNFFSAIIQCFRRTKEQRKFEEELYTRGLAKEQEIMIQHLNEIIVSKELAKKFVLQELDIASKGDASLQYFVNKSGFHVSEYLGALGKFQEDKEKIEMIQFVFLNFLNKISDDQRMHQTAMNILNGIMEHWKIGKYSPDGGVFFEEETQEETVLQNSVTKPSLALYVKDLKSTVMQKLEVADDKIQDVLDKFNKPKEQEQVKEEVIKKEEVKAEVPKRAVKIYTDEYVDVLMEKHSDVIKEIITGNINPENSDEVKTFQSEISLATLEGHNLASVFCAFFETESTLPITSMNETSKAFFIQILNIFDEEGFSESLDEYLEINRDDVYALATEGDKFMQYLIGFWYVFENEDKSKVEEEQYYWYNQSALNGFKPAIEKLENSNYKGE